MVTMSGDRRVLSELFDTEWEAMVRLAFLLTGRRSVAEEVVQDAFAALHDRVDDLERPGAYLRRCWPLSSRHRPTLWRRSVPRMGLSATRRGQPGG